MPGFPFRLPAWWRRTSGFDISSTCKGRTGGQTLVEGVALKEAAGTIPTTKHKARSSLEGKAQARHEFDCIRSVVTSTCGTDNRSRNRPNGQRTRILNGACSQQYVRSLVVLLIPGLILLVTKAKVDRETRSRLEVILDIPGDTPLPLTNSAQGRRNLSLVHQIQNQSRLEHNHQSCWRRWSCW